MDYGEAGLVYFLIKTTSSWLRESSLYFKTLTLSYLIKN